MLVVSAPANAWSRSEASRQRVVDSRVPRGEAYDAWTETSVASAANTLALGQPDPLWSQADVQPQLVLRYRILEALTRAPGLDDVALAERIGAAPFEVSQALRAMAADGLVEVA